MAGEGAGAVAFSGHSALERSGTWRRQPRGTAGALQPPPPLPLRVSSTATHEDKARSPSQHSDGLRHRGEAGLRSQALRGEMGDKQGWGRHLSLVQFNEGFQLLGDETLVGNLVLVQGASSKALEGDVVEGLHHALGEQLLIQQLIRRLLEGVGGVHVGSGLHQGTHDQRAVVAGGDVQRGVVVIVAAVRVGPALQKQVDDVERWEFAHGITSHCRGIFVHSHMQRSEAVLGPGAAL